MFFSASPRQGHLGEVFSPTRLKWDHTFQAPSSFPSAPQKLKHKASLAGAGVGSAASPGDSGAAPPPLRPSAPAGVPEEAAVFLGPRRGWVGTAGDGRGGVRGRGWDAGAAPAPGHDSEATLEQL